MIENRNTIVVIPARMAATRLPGKPLADINGLPMIVHVWKRAVEAKVGQVLVAVAESEIAAVIRKHGGDAIITDANLPSGSDRIAQALELRDPQGRFEHVVNLQGDFPTIETLAIQRCLAGLSNEQVDISTIAAVIKDQAEADNPNVVKAIAPLSDMREVAFARDFTRIIPPGLEPPYWHHFGVYAFRRAALRRFVSLAVSANETARKLEQMRAMDNGMKIAVVKVDTGPIGVDSPAELEHVRQLMKAQK